MRYILNKLTLTKSEKIKIQLVCIYFGYSFRCDDNRNSYIIISDEDIAYIQRNEKLGLFIIWKKTEYINRIEDLVNIVNGLNIHNIVPDTVNDKSFKKMLIDGLRSLLCWIPGVTIKEECDRYV